MFTSRKPTNRVSLLLNQRTKIFNFLWKPVLANMRQPNYFEIHMCSLWGKLSIFLSTIHNPK
jgi:hypothetical protein